MSEPQKAAGVIFDAAIELPKERQAAFLGEACAGNIPLRQRVEALLRAHEAAGSFMDQPAQSEHKKTLKLSLKDQSGEMIGLYKLLQSIGEGGCGVVYMAEQEKPVRRRVALKVIKLGMDTKNVIARFEAERQALAMMDHPNIAKVLDAGATEAGRPYFVMELVRGIKITDYCDQNNLSTEERLKLFTQVCHAIQHAHQKGIIHRDIKPSNILVTLHDGVPVPKVIDFGIAKATQGRLTDQTLFTAFEQFIGTPAYMSPEQAEMTGLDIDTRSDIYALGVLLYELLTGKTPFDPKELMAEGLDAMRRTIREQEPVRPSTALSTMLDADLTTVARHRHSDAPKLIHLLRGDLDWVVMKCLEKDRTRRYETANGLAMDLQRHLSNEPVAARPPSAGYRFQKFARRNKLVFAAGTAVAMALLLGAVASSWQAVIATGERRVAVRERGRAETEAKRADANAGAEARQRHVAERAGARANQALSSALFDAGDRLAREGNSAKALAHFARALRINPANRGAGQRIISLLDQRDFPLPMAEQPSSLKFNPLSALAYSADLKRFCKVFDTNGTFIAVFDAGSAQMVGRPIPLGDRFDGRVWVYIGMGRVDGGETNRQITIRLNGDGSRLAIGLTNKTTFWECESGRKLAETDGQLESFSPDGKTAVVGDLVVAVESGQRLFSLPPEAMRGRGVFSADGQMLAMVSISNSAAEVFFATNGQRVVPGFPTFISGSTPSLHFSPDGRRLIGSGSHGAVEVWDLVQKRQCLPVLNNGNSVWAMDCSADGRLLVTGTRSGRANLWNLVNGQPAREPCPSAETIWQTCLAPDCSWLATRSVGTDAKDFSHRWEKTRWWDIRAGRSIPIKLIHSDMVWSAVYNSTGSLIRTICKDGEARIWSAQTGELLGKPITHGGGVKVAIFSPDSTFLVTGASGGDVRAWDANSGQEFKLLGRHETRVTALALSPDGRYLASGAADRRIKIWEMGSGKLLGETPLAEGSDQGVMCLTFNPTGRQLVAGFHSGGAEILEIPSMRRIGRLAERGGSVFQASYSPDGKSIATALGDDSAQLWDAQTGAGPRARYPHESGVWASAFSSDGQMLATASYDHTARVWDTLSGKPITEPLPNPDAIRTVCFSPDDRTVITAGGDGAVIVWDARTGRALSEKFQHEGLVYSACFSPDGRHILTAGKDGVVAISDWVPLSDQPPLWLAELAEAVGGYQLSETGVAEYVNDAAQILDQLRMRFTDVAASDMAGRWGKWYLADRAARAISVFATTSVQDFADRLAHSNDVRSLEQALELGSHNPLIYQRLAGFVAVTQPETASLYRRIAAESGLIIPVPATVSTDGSAPALNADATPMDEVDPLVVEELLKHEGRMVRARGRIVKHSKNSAGNIQYLNFAQNYRSALSLVFKLREGSSEIAPEALDGFTNKTVVVEGHLIDFRGAPEIEIASLAQIKILEETAPSLSAVATDAISAGPPAAADSLEPLDGRNGEPFLKREGQIAKVKGRIVRFGSAASSHIYYLDFTGNYRSGCSLVFFEAHNPTEFRPEILRPYVGKNVVVEGTVTTYQGRPQIEVKSLADLKVVDEGAAAPQKDSRGE